MENRTVTEWLIESKLEDLVPIFERELLTDWDYVKRLNLPLLQSIHVPLGLAFEFQDAIQKLFGPKICSNPEFESTAMALYEWIVKHSQSPVRKEKRPPWYGVNEKPNHTLVPKKAALDTGLKYSSLIRKKVTKVLSFPESPRVLPIQQQSDQIVDYVPEKRPQFEQEPKMDNASWRVKQERHNPRLEPVKLLKPVARSHTEQTLDDYVDDYEEYHPESEPIRSHPKIRIFY
jgi:hypothetical protein